MTTLGGFRPPIARTPRPVVHLPSEPPARGIRTDLCSFHPTTSSYEPYARQFSARAVSCSFDTGPSTSTLGILDVTLHIELNDGKTITAKDFFKGTDPSVLQQIYIVFQNDQIRPPRISGSIWPKRALFGPLSGSYVSDSSKLHGANRRLLAACVAEGPLLIAVLAGEVDFFKGHGTTIFFHQKDSFVRLEGPVATSVMFTPPGFFIPRG